MRSLFLILMCLFLRQNVNGQKIDPKFSFNVELGLPGAISNKAFNDIMQGLVGTSLYGQYSFPFHLNFGAGLRYSLFNINEFAVPSPVDGGFHSAAGFIKIGWDKFHNDQFATDIGVKVGYSENFFITDVNKKNGLNSVKVDSPLIESTIGLILSADNKNAYRLVLGHGIQGFKFRPDMIGLVSNEGYSQKNLSKLTNYFIVGFGYTYYFNKEAVD